MTLWKISYVKVLLGGKYRKINILDAYKVYFEHIKAYHSKWKVKTDFIYQLYDYNKQTRTYRNVKT